LVVRPAGAQDVRVQDVQAYQQGKNVVIEYDLKGDSRVTFDVDLRLSRNGGQSFDYAPTALSGAVGSGITSGQGKEIVWAVLQDFPSGIEGEDYQFKVLATQEGSGPTRPARAQRQTPSQPETRSNVNQGDNDGGVTARLGVGLAYNTREQIQVQYYDGYQASFWLELPSSLGLKVNYRTTTGTFRQSRAVDLDLLYNTGFLYGGAGLGIFQIEEDLFENNRYNLSGVVGIGFSLGGIFPYVEYRYPFSRGQRDDMLSGGLLYSF
jgi:hypothetical protein